MSQGYSGLFQGTRGSKSRGIEHQHEEICRIRQLIADARSGILETIDETHEQLTPYERRAAAASRALKRALDEVDEAEHLFWAARWDYIAEGCPDMMSLNQD